MRLDLHVHTNASDGAWSAERVVEGAVKGRLDVIAISDHDTTASVGPAQEAARGLNLQVVSAVELSSTHGVRELHILGYFIDPNSPVILEHQARARELRELRMREMIRLLDDLGLHLTFEAVLEGAGPLTSVLARPHLAQALVDAGHVESVNEAFNSLIGDSGPAFVPTRLQDPLQAVDVVKRAGGVSSWAHPPVDLLPTVLPSLVDAGLQGLEVLRPGSRRSLVERLGSQARSYGLFVTGGSDWHGPDRNGSLGDFFVTSEEVGDLLEAGGM